MEPVADMGMKPEVTKPKRSFDTLKSTKPKRSRSRSEAEAEALPKPYKIFYSLY